MSSFLEKPPIAKRSGAVVHIIDETGGRTMLLGTFVAYATSNYMLAQQWIGETCKPAKLRSRKRVDRG